jgi:hypothetical protein
MHATTAAMHCLLFVAKAAGFEPTFADLSDRFAVLLDTTCIAFLNNPRMADFF